MFFMLGGQRTRLVATKGAHQGKGAMSAAGPGRPFPDGAQNLLNDKQWVCQPGDAGGKSEVIEQGQSLHLHVALLSRLQAGHLQIEVADCLGVIQTFQ